jgi:hypothetical protein
MNIELRNIKTHAGLSEETHAYTATVYWNGRKAIEVSNHGHGGGDMQYPVAPFTYDDVTYIDAICENELPMWGSQFDPDEGDTHRTDLEMWCSEEVNDFLSARDLKRKLKSRALFTMPDEKGLFEIKYRGRKPYDAALGDNVEKRNEGAKLLNRMTFDEALKAYLAVA